MEENGMPPKLQQVETIVLAWCLAWLCSLTDTRVSGSSGDKTAQAKSKICAVTASWDRDPADHR